MLVVLIMSIMNTFVIPAEKVKESGMPVEEFLMQQVPIARTFARPPVSDYYVGVAALGGSGNVYLGVNLEFAGFPLSQSVHGEQFAITMARNFGETKVVAMAMSAAPCGHCRQFLNEIGEDMILILPSGKGHLSSFLPDAFGPHDLGLEGGLLELIIVGADEWTLVGQAKAAAKRSYAPYTFRKAGVAIGTKDGSCFTGSYLENAAYNPSLPPLQAALIELVAHGKLYEEIAEVVLVEGKDSGHEILTREIIKSIAPHAKFSKVVLQ